MAANSYNPRNFRRVSGIMKPRVSPAYETQSTHPHKNVTCQVVRSCNSPERRLNQPRHPLIYRGERRRMLIVLLLASIVGALVTAAAMLLAGFGLTMALVA